jgi:putative oxidoreductase
MIQADASWLDTAGRLLIAGFFLAAGACNLTPKAIQDHIERMAAFGVPLPAAAFWFGIALQFTGCALLIADWHSAIGVGCLIVFTAAATAIFHRFWSMQDPAKRNVSRIILLGNTGILGGLLLLLENVR